MAAVAGGAAAALVVTLVVTAMLARVVSAVASLDRATRELGRAVQELGGEAVLLGRDGLYRSDGTAVRTNGGSDGGADAVDRGAPPSTGRVDGRSRLPDLALVSPVIKARALGRGTSLAARQFRLRRER